MTVPIVHQAGQVFASAPAKLGAAGVIEVPQHPISQMLGCHRGLALDFGVTSTEPQSALGEQRRPAQRGAAPKVAASRSRTACMSIPTARSAPASWVRERVVSPLADSRASSARAPARSRPACAAATGPGPAPPEQAENHVLVADAPLAKRLSRQARFRWAANRRGWRLQRSSRRGQAGRQDDASRRPGIARRDAQTG